MNDSKFSPNESDSAWGFQNEMRKGLLVIEAGMTAKHYWRDLWYYRELFVVLAWRDVIIRYKQTVIGIVWAVIRPFITMIIFSFVFNRIAGLPPQGGVPYMLMVLAGTLPWFLFATALGEGSNALTGGASMVQKIYFPRLIMPVASTMVALIDLVISLGLFAVFAVALGFLPDWRIIFLPVFIIYGFFVGLGPALLLSALTVRYRDFRFITPFIVQFGLFVSPVGFASAAVPQKYQVVFHLNPVVGVIDGFRWALLRGEVQLNPVFMAVGVLVTMTVLWIGLSTFRKMERTFADLV